MDTATTVIYTLSLHDALPIFAAGTAVGRRAAVVGRPGQPGHGHPGGRRRRGGGRRAGRSEEHTSELQSRGHLVCRLLLEKKNANRTTCYFFERSKYQTETSN